jgi:hypothetical protein
MKKTWMLVAILAVAVVLVLGGSANAAEKTLKGTLVCAKCTLKEKLDACTNALKVKEGDKEVVYYLQDKGKDESYHKGICPAGKSVEATVTGEVSEKDGKKFIKPSKVETK